MLLFNFTFYVHFLVSENLVSKYAMLLILTNIDAFILNLTQLGLILRLYFAKWQGILVEYFSMWNEDIEESF
jgi:hypothetical protein